jgi:histidine triad (HIT) family protein
MSDCIFCKIIEKQIPSTIILETNSVLVIKDISPKAQIHYLIVPKKHIEDLRSFAQGDLSLAGELLFVAQQLSAMHNNSAFKLLVNNGYQAGQRVFHLHIHFLAGSSLPEWF